MYFYQIGQIYLLFFFFLMYTFCEDNITSNSSNSDDFTNLAETDRNLNDSYVYTNNLTEEDKSNYKSWIKLRIGFNETKSPKCYKLFQPEKKEYYKSILKFSIVFFAIAIVFAIIFLFILFLTFFCKKCRGPKNLLDQKNYSKLAYFYSFVGFIITFVFYSISLVYSSKVNNRVFSIKHFSSGMSEAVITQLNVTNQNILDLSNYSLIHSNKTLDVNFSVAGAENLIMEYSNMSTKFKDFGETLYHGDTYRYILSINNLIILCILSGLGLLAYFLKRNNFLLIISYAIFLNLIATYIIMGLNSSYFILSIDICQNINLQISNISVPLENEGLGYYISCPSKVISIIKIKQSQMIAKIIRYKALINQNEIVKDLNITFSQNSSYDFIKLPTLNNNILNSYKERLNKIEQNGIDVLIKYNNLFYNLEIFLKCKFAISFANYSEENYCKDSLNYHFKVMLFASIGTFGLIILSIGFNKLCVIIDPKNIHPEVYLI